MTIKKICSYGNSLFSSPVQSDFNILAIFSPKNNTQVDKQPGAPSISISLPDEAPSTNIKLERQRSPGKKFNVGKFWKPK